MSRLDLGNLADPEESAWYCIHEGPMEPGLLGTQYDLICRPAECVSETLRIGLRGSPAELRAVIRRLERIAELVRLNSEHGIGHAIYLRAFPPESAGPVYTRLLHAELQTLPGALVYEESGAMAVDLVITRRNCFDGAEQTLSLANSGSSGYSVGLKNLDDSLSAGNDNYFYINTAGLESDLPAPLRLQVTNNSNKSLRQLFVGAFHERASTEKPLLTLEGEYAAEAEIITSAGASNGAYGRFSVPDGSWQDAAGWELSYSQLAALGGRMFLPLLRFQTPLAADGARFRLELRQAGASAGPALCQTPAAAAQSGAGFLALAPLRLPFGALSPRYAPAALHLSLQAFIPAAGSHTINIDDLSLLPQDDFAWFNFPAGLAAGSRLMDDGFARESFSLTDVQQLRAHERVGTWFGLPAGVRSWFYFFQVDEDGMAPTQASIGLQAWWRSRRQIL